MAAPEIDEPERIRVVDRVVVVVGEHNEFGGGRLALSLEDPLSEKVLHKEFPAGATVLVDVDPDEETGLSFTSVMVIVTSPTSIFPVPSLTT